MAKVKILSHDIDVVEDDPSLWSSGGMGRASTLEIQIVINSGMSEDAKRSTTLHEFIHIISGLLQLELSEQQTDGVAVGIHSLLKDNKKFMEKLYG